MQEKDYLMLALAATALLVMAAGFAIVLQH